ncbi:hypothetical protein PARPLA_00435 [Rhodobacteraceae bacterium THAF1]|uniref:hypothetical protein n=1 Tax=Palleronia sp. THAF1 TaxID=2587842 RepID=UPI000F3C877D|nr:hypothetical protein [Palleronia sp. THAF1]QFU10002.1 hypothetical protein FIU81_15085 [Palleronia sp. THAF1]VDC17093.1 hypothetical protein PARPLA_00435 [Rhodobacteraceae bacterium THAF1]
MKPFAVILVLTVAACGADGQPEPVTPGIETTGDGVRIDVSGTATIGVSGSSR